jgi:hypothetical protein
VYFPAMRVTCAVYFIFLDFLILTMFDNKYKLWRLSLLSFLQLLRSKYSPQHIAFKHPQSKFFSLCERPNFTPIQYSKSYSFVYFSPNVSRNARRQMIMNRMVLRIARI